MPHDRNGIELRVGDVVNVPVLVKKIELTEDYCNVTLETVHKMEPGQYPSSLTLNSRQTEAKPSAPPEQAGVIEIRDKLVALCKDRRLHDPLTVPETIGTRAHLDRYQDIRVVLSTAAVLLDQSRLHNQRCHAPADSVLTKLR